MLLLWFLGDWLLAIGCWRLAVGGWRLAVGCWLLAVGWLKANGQKLTPHSQRASIDPV